MIEDIPLSNFDIEHLVGEFAPRANIKVDTNIKPNSSFDDFFGDQGHLILYHSWDGESGSIGHWYCILRDRFHNILFFDSLGHPPDFYSKSILPFLKNNGAKNVFINTKKIQKNTSNCCGKFCVLIAALNKIPLNISQIYKYLDYLKKQYGSYDNGVLNIVK